MFYGKTCKITSNTCGCIKYSRKQCSRGYCFYNKARNLLSQASFKLRKFQSNSTDLEILVNGYKNDNAQEDVEALGFFLWDKSDEIIFNFIKTFKTNKVHSDKRRSADFFNVNIRSIGTAESICVSIKAVVSKDLCSKAVVGRELV